MTRLKTKLITRFRTKLKTKHETERLPLTKPLIDYKHWGKENFNKSQELNLGQFYGRYTPEEREEIYLLVKGQGRHININLFSTQFKVPERGWEKNLENISRGAIVFIPMKKILRLLVDNHHERLVKKTRYLMRWQGVKHYE